MSLPSKIEGFEPEMIAVMAAAYEKVCNSVAAGPHAEVVREVLAKRIIELAQQGLSNSENIYNETLRSLYLTACK
jgi:hypothetical protein